jgi:choline dehydrogenase-like flavoprotein
MRSGIEHTEIGKNLFLHPTFPIPALYPQKIEIWKGVPMSMSVDAFVHFDKNYGFKIETPPVHLGTMAVALPWKNAKTHQNLMDKAANIGAFFALLRDRQGGNVRLSKAGKPIIDYKMQPQDWETALVAMENLLLMHENAGALETYLVHTDCQTFEHGKGLNIKEFVRKQRWQSNRFTIFSAHQMGTVRMGADKKRFPISPNGNFFDYPNVYVADASVFPSASGANPMITVLALAYFISKRI